MRIIWLVGLFGFSAFASTAPLPTVPHVDLDRYLGTWYEIARFPNRFQRGCDQAKANYSRRDDGRISVLNTCVRAKDGAVDDIEGVARVVDTQSYARLKVSFLPGWLRWTGIGSGDYWVVDLDPDYRFAAVSEPKRNYLWILSREPQMDRETYESILSRLRALDLDVSKLIFARPGAVIDHH